VGDAQHSPPSTASRRRRTRSRPIRPSDAAVDTANARLSRVEQVKPYTVLPVFWEPGSDEITPTMKLRRSVIAGKFAVEIDVPYERDWT
jgi:long-subunit acyl-CoA synthetase (AMP-forming)